MRATRTAMLAGSLCAGLPFFAGVLWLSTRHEAVDAWLDRPVWLRALDLFGLLVLMTLIGGVTAMVISRHATASVMGPLRELSHRAEQVGGGETQVPFEATGLDEIDRVSDALAQSAQRLSRALATERGFASDASHQLRTPLTALMMRIE